MSKRILYRCYETRIKKVFKENIMTTKGNLICYEAEVIGNIYDSPELLEEL